MNTKNTQRGFTLIEMIVSLGLFSVVAVVALGALLKIINANNKAQSLQTAITNLNFSLEAMSREMRVGARYNCTDGATTVTSPSNPFTGRGCESDSGSSSSGVAIAFVSSKTNSSAATPNTCNLISAYRFVPSTLVAGAWNLEKASQDPSSVACGEGFADSDFSSIVDPNVTITSYLVEVSSNAYPMAYIKISGYSGTKEAQRTYFDIQTAVSARTQ